MVSPVQSPAVDLEPAIKEMTRGYDLAVQLHCILLAQKPESRSMTLDLADKIVRAFKVSIDALKPQNKSSNARVEVKEAPKPSKNVISHVDNGEDGAENSRKRKGKDESWKTVTSTPHHDGYQWRKYGEKKIRGTIFPRCYYRCTYLHDQNCQATKQVQQLNSDDPPLFDVTYNRRHTCYNVSSLKQNGEAPPQTKDGYPTCIVFGAADMDDDDDEVTIVSSSSTNSREMDPAVLRQLNQDATKRQRTNPTVGTTQQLARANLPAVGPSPSPSGLTTVRSTSPPVQPVSTAREGTNMDSTLLRHLNQEATKMLRRTSVMAPTPLSVAGPTPLSAVGPTAYSAAGRIPSELGATPTSVGPSSSVLATVRSAVPPVHSIPTSRDDMALDPSLMRHMNQEAVKRMRTGSNFGMSPSAVVGPMSTNSGDRSGTLRPRHCTSFPPFTFSTTRFDRSMSQNGSSIESLFTLPSERSLDPKIANSNSQIQNQMEGMFTRAQVEGSSSMSLVNPNGSRVKRSLSDNRIQMEGSTRVSLIQKSPNISLLDPSLTRVRRSLSQEQNEIEGVYTLSSMDMLPISNLAKPNSSRLDKSPIDINLANPNARSTNPSTDSSSPHTSRFRNLLRNRSQMEGALSMSPMDKKLFLETALANASNAANANASEIDKNTTEGMPSVSSMERLADASTVNHDTNKGGRIENQMDGVFSQSSAERSYETNSENRTENEENRTLLKSQSQIESAISLSSRERSPGTSTVNPNSNEEDGMMLDNQAETEVVLSLSSKRSSDANFASREESSIGIELSLSSVEKSHSMKGVGKSLPQGPGEMEGVLSLSTKPDLRSEMFSILTPASVEGSTHRNSENPNTIRGEKSLSLNSDRMEASLSFSIMERSCDTNLEKNDSNGAEKSLVLQPGQMKEGLTMEKNSPELNLANQGQMEGASSLPPKEMLPDTNLCTEHQGQRERSSEANSREPNLSQMASTSGSSMEKLSSTTVVQPDANAQQHRGIFLELNLPPRSPMLPTEQPPPPPLPPPPPPPPPPISPPPPPSMPQSSKESQKSNEEISQLEATVAELRSKLEHSKEEAVTTKEKVTTLEAQMSAIKAATEAWQKIMAEEASKRVAEAVSRFTSTLHAGPSEGSRRTEILFPGAEDDDDAVVEVPSLLSQLEKNN